MHRYFADPSGTFTRYKAKAIGSGSEAAQNSLQEKYKDDITLVEAEKLSLTILREVMEEKINSVNIQLAKVTPDGGFQIYTEAEVSSLLALIGDEMQQ